MTIIGGANYAIGWSHIYVIILTYTNVIRSANKNVGRYNFITLGFIATETFNRVHNSFHTVYKLIHKESYMFG